MTETLRQRVIKNTAYSVLSTLVSRIGGLIFTIIVARILFPEMFGIYSLVLTIILTLCTFTDLGINSTVIRYLAESLKKKNSKTESQSRSRINFLFNFKILLTAAISFALFLLANSIAVYIFKKPVLTTPLQIGAIYLFVMSLQSFLTSIFYSLQKVNYNAIAEIIFQVLRIVLVLVFFLFYKNVGSVFISLSIAIFISCIFLFFILFSKFKFLLKGDKPSLKIEERKRLMSFFGWLSMSSLSLIFFVHIDTFILGVLVSNTAFIGYYQSIFSIVGTGAAFITFSNFLLPVFTQISKEKLERNFKKVLYYLSSIAIPVSIGLAFVIIPAIRFIYGNVYVPTQYHLAITITAAILSLAVLETALSSLYYTLFQAKEKPKNPALVLLFATIANVILCYVFIKIGLSISPEYAIIGAAIAVVLTRYANLIVLGILSKKEFGIGGNISTVLKPILATLVMVAFLIFFNLMIKITVKTLIIEICLAAIIYIVLFLLMGGVKKEDLKIKYLIRNKNEQIQTKKDI